MSDYQVEVRVTPRAGLLDPQGKAIEGALYFRAENLKHREQIKNETCPTCLSPCQVNVGAMKQFIPYAKFLKRAYQVKRAPERHQDTLPAVEQTR